MRLPKKIILCAMFICTGAIHADYVEDSADIARHVIRDQLGNEDMKAGDKNTINQGANSGQASQNAGAAANAAAGAALIASGMALLPNPLTAAQGAQLISMGMQALAQAGHDSGAAGKSGATAAASVLKDKGPTTQQPVPGEAEFKNEIKKAQAALNDKGFSVTDKGLLGPDGKLTPASAFASTAAMKEAGLNAAVVKEVEKINAAIADELAKYKASGAVVNGGGGAASGEQAVSAEPAAAGGANPFAIGSDKQRAMMAGKTVNLDGEPIGVAGANIFEMVHDAYQKKRTGNQFIEAEGKSPPALRSPASNKK